MNKKPIQRALIVGATSGIGKETALHGLATAPEGMDTRTGRPA